MTTAILIKKTFNGDGSLIVPEVQSIIIMVGSMVVGMEHDSLQDVVLGSRCTS